MQSNTTFKVYNDQPVRYSNIAVGVGLGQPVSYYPYHNLNFETQVSGQFTEFLGPKEPDDMLVTFDADDATLPAANNAALISFADHDFLAFDAASSEGAYFDGVMPENYTGKNIQVRLGWTSQSASAGNVMWEASLAHLTGANNLFTTTFLPAVSGLDTPTVSGAPQEMLLQMTSDNLGNMSKVEDYRLRIRRVGGVAADTMTGDAYLFSVGLEELY